MAHRWRNQTPRLGFGHGLPQQVGSLRGKKVGSCLGRRYFKYQQYQTVNLAGPSNLALQVIFMETFTRTYVMHYACIFISVMVIGICLTLNSPFRTVAFNLHSRVKWGANHQPTAQWPSGREGLKSLFGLSVRFELLPAVKKI